MQLIKHKYYFFLLVLCLSCQLLYAQNHGCIDINNRIKYSFDLQGGLLAKPISANTNLLIGQYSEYNNDSAIILAKTYLDSIIWAKKYNSSARQLFFGTPYQLPDSSILLSSGGTVGKLYLTRLSENGNLIWAKKVTLSIPTLSFGSNNQSSENIVVAGNNFYLTTNVQIQFTGYLYKAITKFDFNGNIIWSTILVNTESEIGLNDPLSIVDNVVNITSNITYRNFFDAGIIDSMGVIITKLNALDGTVLSNYELNVIPDKYSIGLITINAKVFLDNSICLSGVIAFNYDGPKSGIYPISGTPFVLLANDSLTNIKAAYYLYKYATKSVNFLIPPTMATSINDNKQTGFLLSDDNNKIGYAVIIDSNTNIYKSRAFYPQTQSQYFFFLSNAYFLSNEETVYYSFSSNPALHVTNLEYSRINNLTPANTLECFGKDSSVLERHPFFVTKDTFSWSHEYHNLVITTDIDLTEQPFTINSETICTQKSICDTIKVKGDSCFTLSIPTASFMLYKNPLCMRQTKWLVDTTAIKIISQPNDSTLNVRFLKPYHGYVKATFEGCTLKDSLYINVYPATAKLWLGNDTIYCPTKPIILHAGNGFKTYTWQDNSAMNFFTANAPGIYFVTVTDSCNNILSDTITIKPLDAQLSLNYPNTLCLYDTAFISLDSRFTNYIWNPADAGITQNNLLKLFPIQSTLFNVSAESSIGCSISDTILIKVEECPIYFYIPNAFTPNNDGSNDIFKPIVSGNLAEYHFEIYNRFGQKIFTTKQINEGWNGTIKGMPQNTGIYIWLCSYKFRNKQVVFKKGTVLLVR